MNNRIYQIVELVGTSRNGIEEAVNNAIVQAAKLHGKLDWYEILETRGFVKGSKSRYYQVHLKAGCHAH